MNWASRPRELDPVVMENKERWWREGGGGTAGQLSESEIRNEEKAEKGG